jgi:hypothetical protein
MVKGLSSITKKARQTAFVADNLKGKKRAILEIVKRLLTAIQNSQRKV